MQRLIRARLRKTLHWNYSSIFVSMLRQFPVIILFEEEIILHVIDQFISNTVHERYDFASGWSQVPNWWHFRLMKVTFLFVVAGNFWVWSCARGNLFIFQGSFS